MSTPRNATLPPTANAAADRDARGCPVTGADAASLAHFEQALSNTLAWRGGADEPLERALQAAPGMVMARVLQGWLLVLGRDRRRIQQGRPVLERARQVQGPHERERLHLAAIAAVLDDDYPLARALLGQLLRQTPHDVLALHAAHSLDYLTGDIEQLSDRVAQVLPAWDESLPGHHAVLSMQAFGLAERGEVAAAERAARAALALNPLDARAHHVMAHVFETTDRPAEGARWLEQHAQAWSTSRAVATHCAWHLALFCLALGDTAGAIDLFDRCIPAARSGDLADLIDASALLWRLQLFGVDLGPRWQALAAAWAPHIDDHYCSFGDVHAMLAFAGARDEVRVQRLLHSLEAAQSQPTRYGMMTRRLGLPACRALAAFGRGEHTLAITLLASLPAEAHRLGGSHAQRDVLHLTLLQAVERIRRPVAAPRGQRGDADSSIRTISA